MALESNGVSREPDRAGADGPVSVLVVWRALEEGVGMRWRRRISGVKEQRIKGAVGASEANAEAKRWNATGRQNRVEEKTDRLCARSGGLEAPLALLAHFCARRNAVDGNEEQLLRLDCVKDAFNLPVDGTIGSKGLRT